MTKQQIPQLEGAIEYLASWFAASGWTLKPDGEAADGIKFRGLDENKKDCIQATIFIPPRADHKYNICVCNHRRKDGKDEKEIIKLEYPPKDDPNYIPVRVSKEEIEASKREQEKAAREAEEKRRNAFAESLKRYMSGTPDRYSDQLEGRYRHEYLKQKRIGWTDRLMVVDDLKAKGQKVLLIPYEAIDDGELAVKAILGVTKRRDNGRIKYPKKLMAGSQTTGAFYRFCTPEKLNNAKTIGLCEGFATGWALQSILDDSQIPILSVGPKSNLIHVKNALLEVFPDKEFIFFCDVGGEVENEICITPHSTVSNTDWWDVLDIGTDGTLDRFLRGLEQLKQIATEKGYGYLIPDPAEWRE